MPVPVLPRFLGYLTLPGYCSGELYEYGSLREAAHDLAARAATGPCGDDPHVDLYRVADREMVKAAHDFADTGIPFDCLDFRMTLDPRGDTHIQRG